MTSGDGPGVVTFDATNDVVTCTRHNIVHPMTATCPACDLSWSLVVERFAPIPPRVAHDPDNTPRQQRDRRAALRRATRGRL